MNLWSSRIHSKFSWAALRCYSRFSSASLTWCVRLLKAKWARPSWLSSRNVPVTLPWPPQHLIRRWLAWWWHPALLRQTFLVRRCPYSEWTAKRLGATRTFWMGSCLRKEYPTPKCSYRPIAGVQPFSGCRSVCCSFLSRRTDTRVPHRSQSAWTSRSGTTSGTGRTNPPSIWLRACLLVPFSSCADSSCSLRFHLSRLWTRSARHQPMSLTCSDCADRWHSRGDPSIEPRWFVDRRAAPWSSPPTPWCSST